MVDQLSSPSPLKSPFPNHILPCRRRRLHAIITPNGQRKNNGENSLRLCDFTVLTLTIFSIKLLLPGPSCDGRYINSQTDFALPFPLTARVCCKVAETQK